MTAGGGIVVRERRDDDLEACVAVLRLVHETDGYPVRAGNVAAHWLQPPAAVGAWVAELDGRIVGHVVLVAHARPDSVEVTRFFSDPAIRGSGVGVGVALLDVAVAYGGQLGRQVVLEVVEGTAAVRFYERRGWRPTGRHVADWAAADGTHPVLLTFDAPA